MLLKMENAYATLSGGICKKNMNKIKDYITITLLSMLAGVLFQEFFKVFIG